MSAQIDLEHHVMERPRIPTARRKPSMKRMDMETNTLVDVELNQENASSANQLEQINSQKQVVAPRLPKKEPECENENHIQQQQQQQQHQQPQPTIQQQIHEPVLSNRKSMIHQPTLQQQINERVLSSRKFGQVQQQQQQQQQSTLPQQHASSERIMSSRRFEQGQQGQEEQRENETNKEQRVLSNRKWARILGCPMDESQLLQEQSKLKRVAKGKGAHQKDIDFMLEQMKTVQHIERIQQQNNKPLDYVQRRLILQSTRSVSSRRRTTGNKILLALN